MMSRMGNLRFADHNFSSGEESESIPFRVSDKVKNLSLEDLKKVFSSPVIITDERLRQILPGSNDQIFDDIIGISGDRYFFKKSHYSDGFTELVDGQTRDQSGKNSKEKIISVFKDGSFQKFLKFKNLSENKKSLIIAIFVIDIWSIKPFEPKLLRDLFGLTLAESRVAICLHNGLSVNDAAEQSGVRTSTVRDQLSSIFSKTRTSRQSELVSILSRLELVVG